MTLISYNFVCDGRRDCYHGNDEDVCNNQNNLPSPMHLCKTIIAAQNISNVLGFIASPGDMFAIVSGIVQVDMMKRTVTETHVLDVYKTCTPIHTF